MGGQTVGRRLLGPQGANNNSATRKEGKKESFGSLSLLQFLCTRRSPPAADVINYARVNPAPQDFV